MQKLLRLKVEEPAATHPLAPGAPGVVACLVALHKLLGVIDLIGRSKPLHHQEAAACVVLQYLPALKDPSRQMKRSCVCQIFETVRGVVVQLVAICFKREFKILESSFRGVLVRRIRVSRLRRFWRPPSDGGFELRRRESMLSGSLVNALEQRDSLVRSAGYLDRPKQHQSERFNLVRAGCVRGGVDEVTNMGRIPVVRFHIEWQAQTAPDGCACQDEFRVSPDHPRHEQVDTIRPAD